MVKEANLVPHRSRRRERDPLAISALRRASAYSSAMKSVICCIVLISTCATALAQTPRPATPPVRPGIEVFLSDDAKEGPRAFKEKRPPKFQMK